MLDVANRAAVYAFADEVLAHHGSAQIIINNAGVAVSQTVADLCYDDFEWLMGINFWGVVHGTKGMSRNQPGVFVKIEDTIKGFKMIVEGECDSIPEQAFYMVGSIDEALEKAKTL